MGAHVWPLPPFKSCIQLAAISIWLSVRSEVSKMAKKTLADKTLQNEDNVKNNDDIFNDDEEPNFSDPEGFVDDITDEGKQNLSSMNFHQ